MNQQQDFMNQQQDFMDQQNDFMKQQFNDNYERHTRRDERAILSAYRKHMVRKMPGVKNGYRRNRKG